MIGQLDRLLEQLDTLRARAIEQLAAITTQTELKEWDTRYLGRKNGALTALRPAMQALSQDERRIVGQKYNAVKSELEQLLATKRETTRQQAMLQSLMQEGIDVTLGGHSVSPGHMHLISRTALEMARIFSNMGFQIRLGSEIETDYYNFRALNFPVDHPARDMQDTFWVAPGEILLRTQTSSMQIHTMTQMRPPVRVATWGRVYRNETINVSNAAMLHQFECFIVDEQCTMANLKGCLQHFIARMFGPERRIRFRGSYFPFTEPSAELDISCGICGGTGCSTCKHTGWLELLGCGMIHPNVLREVGYDPKKYRGFAFGAGVERIAMAKYAISDIRTFTTNDLRMLQQF